MRIETFSGRIAIPAREAVPSRMTFSPGQWLQAEVVSVADDTAVLDFQVVSMRVRPLVPLAEGARLLLQVVSTTPEQILLRLFEPADIAGGNLRHLLEQIGVQATGENQQAALALLQAGLSPSSEDLALILQATRSGVAEDLQEAALVRALGLPLTSEVLAALREKSTAIGALWQKLLSDLPDESAPALHALPVTLEVAKGSLVAALRQTILALGRSMEHKLLHASPEWTNDLKASLLQAIRDGAGASDLLRLLHSQQFVNLPRPDQTHPFLYFQFPVCFPEGMCTAQLRIERDGEGGLEGDGALKATFRVDTVHLGTLQASLTLLKSTLACEIRCAHPAAARLIRKAADALRQSLALGGKYTVASVKVTIGTGFEDLRAEPVRSHLRLNMVV